MDEILIRGRVHKFGDDINTDIISPGQYLACSREVIAAHAMEGICPGFSSIVQKGDIIVAGKNFGSGSSRETAALALKDSGIAAIIAPSFARIFYRNSINIGLPALICVHSGELRAGDYLEVLPLMGKIKNISTETEYACEPLLENIARILKNGGLLNDLEQQYQIGNIQQKEI